MQLKPFRLEEWLDAHERDVQYDLAASTGPSWTLDELIALMSDEEREQLFHTPLTYCPGAGRESLRHVVAEMYRASPDEIQMVTGASEALLALFLQAAAPGANVVVPALSFPPFLDVPEVLGLELRRYDLRHEDGFQIDVGAIERLIDEDTKLVLVNSPHNPTGSVSGEDTLRGLAKVTSDRGVQLVVDEVYHPIYRDGHHRSAGEFLDCTVLGDFSKAFSLPGLRIGWLLERDPDRRRAYWNARGHFTISNNLPGEILAEVAVRHRETIFARARETANANMALLDKLFEAHAEEIEWVRPEGGMTAFPRFLDVDDALPFCEAAASKGVLLVPGDCFGFPAHFRLGFGACAEGYEEALEILSGILRERAPVA